MARRYVEVARALPALETFSDDAFAARDRADKAEQELCDFVLTLALVYNDLRDVLMATEYLGGEAPENYKTSVSPEIGEYRSSSLHLERLLFATVHELTKLLQFDPSRRAMADPVFLTIERNLPRVPREAWRALRDGASGGRKGRVSVFVEMCRHKVQGHYEAKPLGLAYRRRFVDRVDRANDGPPLLSRGETMATTRFFFADGAAYEYMRSQGDPSDATLINEIYDHVRNIGHGLRGIVLAFITKRAGWRNFDAPPPPPSNSSTASR